MRLSPEVLPVMGIDTGISWVIGVAVGAPDCFKMEHIEVSVLFEFVQQVNSQFLLSMCKGTHIAVIAAFHPVRVGLTEFNFIFLGMIELLDAVVRLWATVAHRAVVVGLTVSDVRADLA